MLDKIAAAIMAVVAAVFAMIARLFWKFVLTFFSLVFTQTFHLWLKNNPEEALTIWTMIMDTYFEDDPKWVVPVAKYMKSLTGMDIDMSNITTGMFTSGEALGETFLYPMLNLILPGGFTKPEGGVVREAKLVPTDGLEGAERFLGTNLRFQMQAWWLHVLGDMQSFGMFKSLKDLPNAISWSYGLGWLSWLVMGVPFRMGISDPLEKYFNLVYRPQELPRKQLIDAYHAGLVTKDYMLDRLAEMGYDSELIVTILKMERDTLSTAEMRKFLLYDLETTDDLATWFRWRGHSPAEAASLAFCLRDEESQRIRERIANEALSNYQDETFTWAQTEPYLTAAYYTTGERSLMRTLADMRRIPKPPKEPTARSLTAAQIGARYRDKHIDRIEAEALLRALPYQADQINLFLAGYEPEVEKEKEPRDIGKAVVGILYKRGEISEEELRVDLAKLDFEGWGLERLVQYYEPVEPPPPKVLPPRELTASIVFRLHEEGHVSFEDAVARLVVLRIPEDDARLVLETLHPLLPEIEIPPRVVPASIYGALYRDGILEAPEALELFQEVGYDLEGAQWLELYYRPVPVPPPPEIPYRELSATWVFRLHEEAHMPTDEAVERLVRLRIREDDARMLLERLHPVRPPEVQPARVVPASIIGGLYRRELIDTEQALVLFQDVGYDETGAASLELYYRPVEPPPPPVLPPVLLSATWVLRLHREEHITSEDAQARLEELRFTAADAALLLRTIYAVPVPVEQVPRALPASVVGGLYRTGRIDTEEALGLFTTADYGLEGASYLELYYRPVPPVPVLARELRPSEAARLLRDHVLMWPEAWDRLRPEFIDAEETLLFIHLYIKEALPPETRLALQTGQITAEPALEETVEFFATPEDARAYLGL